MQRPERFLVCLSQQEKEVVRRLASGEGESLSVVVRRLIRTEAKARGLWPAPKQAEAVPDDQG